MLFVFLFILGGIWLLNANSTSNNSALSLHSLQQQNQTNSSNNYNFTANEIPAFNFPSIAYASDLKNNVSVHNFKGEVIQADINVTASGNGSSVQIGKTQQFTPGKYSLVINQNGKKIEQDFTWGVLAINPNKSIYKPGETANIALAVLDEKGKMVCDGQVTLEIKNPSGQTTTLSVQNKTITVNPECQQKKYTVNPDYETKHQIGSSGIYQMSLTAVTKNGTYNIVDFFTVEDNPEYDVERITATRIFPYSIYPVSIKITANKDFSGQIRELAPTSLAITPLKNTLEYTNIQEKDGVKYILWNVSLKKGESINIGYNYKPPLISPQFYLLGPLSLISGNTPVFQEKRAWQLAIDAISYYQTILNTPGLVAYWRLAEANFSTVAPEEVNSFSGLYMNGAVNQGWSGQSVSGALVGDSNTALGFQGYGYYVDVAHNATLNVTSNFSLEAWVYPKQLGANYYCVISKGSTGGYNINYSNTGYWVFGAFAVSDDVKTSSTISFNQWHHVVATYGTAAHSGKIYIDGVDLTTFPDTGSTFAGNTSNLDIGSCSPPPGGTLGLGAAIDEVAVYNSILSPSTVLQHYNAGIQATGNFRFNGLKLNGLKIN